MIIIIIIITSAPPLGRPRGSPTASGAEDAGAWGALVSLGARCPFLLRTEIMRIDRKQAMDRAPQALRSETAPKTRVPRMPTGQVYCLVRVGSTPLAGGKRPPHAAFSGTP